MTPRRSPTKRPVRVTQRRLPRKRAKKTTRTRPVAWPAGGPRVLGLDISSTCVGWALFDKGRPVDFGRFVQRAKAHGERLVALREWLLQMLEVHGPTHLIYEEPYRGRDAKVYATLFMHCGIAQMCHVEHFDCPIPDEHRVRPKDVKAGLGVTRGQDHEDNKRRMVERINELYGLSLKFKANDKSKKTSQDDEADAIALVHHWLVSYGQQTPEDDDA